MTDKKYQFFNKAYMLMCLVSLILFIGVFWIYQAKKKTHPSVGIAWKSSWYLTVLNFTIAGILIGKSVL